MFIPGIVATAVAVPCLDTFAPKNFSYHSEASITLLTTIFNSSVAMAVAMDGSSVICTLTLSGAIRNACFAVAPGNGLIPAASHFASDALRLLTLKPMDSTVEPWLGCGGAGGVAGA